jgi:hypothetical protein
MLFLRLVFEIRGAARTGIAGENNATPFSLFPNHQVVRFGTKLYDPSYGMIYEGADPATAYKQALLSFEGAAVAGYAVQGTRLPQAGDPWRPDARLNLWIRASVVGAIPNTKLFATTS